MKIDPILILSRPFYQIDKVLCYINSGRKTLRKSRDVAQLGSAPALGAGCPQLSTLTNWCFQGTRGYYRTNSTPDFYFT